MHSTHTTTVHVYNETCKHWCSKHIYTISKLVGTLYTVHWNANLRHQRWGATCHRHSDRSEQCPPTQATVTDIVIMQQQLRTRLTANNDQPTCDRASLPLENNLEHRDWILHHSIESDYTSDPAEHGSLTIPKSRMNITKHYDAMLENSQCNAK